MINKIKKLKLPVIIIRSLEDGVISSDLIIFCTVLFVTIYEDLMIAIAIGIIFAVLSCSCM